MDGNGDWRAEETRQTTRQIWQTCKRAKQLRSLSTPVQTLCAALLHAPSQRLWAGAPCSGPVRFPPPQGRKATGPQGHRATESKYSSWGTYFLCQVGNGSCPGAYLFCCASSGRSRGGIFNIPRGIRGFKFGGSPPSWPWVIAKQRQVGPENTWNNHPHGPCHGPAMGPHNRTLAAAVPPRSPAAVAPINNGGGPGLSE